MELGAYSPVFKDPNVDSEYYRTLYSLTAQRWMNCQQCVLRIRNHIRDAKANGTPINIDEIFLEATSTLETDNENRDFIKNYACSLKENHEILPQEPLDSLHHFGKKAAIRGENKIRNACLFDKPNNLCEFHHSKQI